MREVQVLEVWKRREREVDRSDDEMTAEANEKYLSWLENASKWTRFPRFEKEDGRDSNKLLESNNTRKLVKFPISIGIKVN